MENSQSSTKSLVLIRYEDIELISILSAAMGSEVYISDDEDRLCLLWEHEKGELRLDLNNRSLSTCPNIAFSLRVNDYYMFKRIAVEFDLSFGVRVGESLD